MLTTSQLGLIQPANISTSVNPVSQLKQCQSPTIIMKPPGFFKQQSNHGRVSGFETNRTIVQSNSQMNLNNLMTQAYMTTQSDSFNQTANLSQIKTDLKDKIQSTRERFN